MSFFKCFFVLIMVIISLAGIAQDEAKPLIERMQRAKGTEKIDLANELSVLFRKSDRYQAINFARQAYTLSVEQNYPSGKALAQKNEGICWFFIGNNDSAMYCYRHALDVFSEIKDEKGISACYNNLGLILQETGKYDDALKYYQLSINIDHKLGDETGVALTLENMANIHMYRGDAKKALVLTNKCIDIYIDNNYKPGLISSYGNRAAEYDYLSKYEYAIRDFKLALGLAKELNNKYEEVKAIGNIGGIYWHMGKPEIAMKYLDEALGNSDETDDAYSIDNVLKTKAQIFTFQKKYIEANEILFKILKRNNDADNARQAAVIMTSIGRNLIELNEVDKASGYLARSLEITRQLEAPYEQLENYRNLTYVNAILHNFAAADSLQDLFAKTYSDIASRDSIVSKNIENKGNSETEKGTASLSSVTEWIIAFSLIVIILLLSVLAFGRKNKEE